MRQAQLMVNLPFTLTSIHCDAVVVFLHFAVGLLFELLAVFRRPPVRKVTICVKLAAFVVKAVRDLMTSKGADVTV